jgi:hypothetical protein
MNKCMKMIQIAKTPRGYLLVDASLASNESASFAPATQTDSEERLRSMLVNFGVAEKEIDHAIRELHMTGQATISLSPPLK